MVADPKYNDKVVSHLINQVMRDGKKSVAVNIVYRTLDILKEKAKVENPLEVLYKAIDNANEITDKPVVIDFRVAPDENVLPMIPAGQTIEQMMVERPR